MMICVIKFFAQVLVNKQFFSRLMSLRCISSTSIVNKSGVDMVDMTDQSLPIPQYKHKEDETLELRKARWDYIVPLMQFN